MAGQLLSVASGYGATEFDTKIPSLGDAANIVEAFKLYHYGIDNYAGATSPAADSIESHLIDLSDRITDLENTPSGGGIVTASVPFTITKGDGTEGELPEGFIWVDQDGSVDSVTAAGVVTFQASEPSSPTHGQVWVDRDASVGAVVVTEDTITEIENDISALVTASASLSSALNSASTSLNSALNSASTTLLSNISVYTIDTKSASYNLQLTDLGKILEFSANSGSTYVTIPTNASVAFLTGSSIGLFQSGSATVIIQGSGSVSVNSFGNDLILGGQWAAATLLKRGTDNWVATGNF
jgi:hypothetical protein